ncbi:MAG: amidase, partial [Paracoccaceae bacterium]|nr:amidase [Paracoccaceae bacterium]
MNLCAQPLADLEVLLRRRQVSCTDLVSDALARIAEVNPVLNAFCFTYPEDALEEAARLDQELAAGHDRGPLHGIPIAIKDFTPTKGRITTRGSYALEHWVPDADPVIVQRLKAAGAIIVGKTTTPEFAHSGMTASALWGIT